MTRQSGSIRNIRVFSLYAAICTPRGQYDRAIADYDEAIRLYPNYTKAINSRAKTIARKNELGGQGVPQNDAEAVK